MTVPPLATGTHPPTSQLRYVFSLNENKQTKQNNAPIHSHKLKTGDNNTKYV